MPISSTRIRYLDKENKVLVKDFSKIKDSTVFSDIRTPIYLTEEAFVEAQEGLRKLRDLQTGVSKIFAGLSDGSVANAVITNILNNQTLFNSGSLAGLAPIVSMIKAAPEAVVNTLMSTIMSEVTEKLYDNPSILDNYKTVSKDINVQIVVAALENFARKSEEANSNGLSGTTNYLNKLTNSGAINDPSLIAETISAIVSGSISNGSSGSGSHPNNPNTSGVLIPTDTYQNGLDNLAQSADGVGSTTFTKQDQLATVIARATRSFQREVYNHLILDKNMFSWFPSYQSIYDFIKKKKISDLKGISESVYSWTEVPEYNLTAAYFRSNEVGLYIGNGVLSSLINDPTATYDDYKICLTFLSDMYGSIAKTAGHNYFQLYTVWGNRETPNSPIVLTFDTLKTTNQEYANANALGDMSMYRDANNYSNAALLVEWRAKDELIRRLFAASKMRTLTEDNITMTTAIVYHLYYQELMKTFLVFNDEQIRRATFRLYEVLQTDITQIKGGVSGIGNGDYVFGDPKLLIIRLQKHNPWEQLHRFFTFIKNTPESDYKSSKLKNFESTSISVVRGLKSLLNSSESHPVKSAYENSGPENFKSVLQNQPGLLPSQKAMDHLYDVIGLKGWDTTYSPEHWDGSWISPVQSFNITKNSITL